MGDAGAIVGVGFLVLAWVVVSMVMPIAAFVSARRARRELVLMRIELADLRQQLAGAPAPPLRTPVINDARVAPPAEVAPPVEEAPVASAPRPVEAPPPIESAPIVNEAPAPPPVEAAPPVAAASPPAASLEEKIALVWFTRIGAAILLLGVAWFFKYAVDNNWIGPLGRVALGALAGVATLVFAEATRPRTRATYVQVLTGVGLALLFFSAYAAHAFYHLVPAPAAFAAVAVVTVLGGALAIHHRGEAILVLSLIAGLLAPVLLSTGEDRPAALFSYLFVLTAFVFWAALRMSFRWATWLAVVGPPILFAVLTALAFASSLLFGRENRRELLLLPLGASFVVLVATVHGSARADVIGVMALLTLWGAVYARAFLQDQLEAGRTPSPGRL